MPVPKQNLTALLIANPNAILVTEAGENEPQQINMLVRSDAPLGILNKPHACQHLDVVRRKAERITDLRAMTVTADPAMPHQACQDEPVKLGTQIQPSLAKWVGTAGAPVCWPSSNGGRLYGILSNWHVMAMDGESDRRPIHQPTEEYPVLAYLSRWSSVSSQETNYIDAAIANAQVGDWHTIADSILQVGKVEHRKPLLQVGDTVFKSGRTTGYTTAGVSAIGAAVRVSYGTFEAVFEDQIVITDQATPFCAAGDSGSLIVVRCDCADEDIQFAPGALLFAGGGGLTVGNPIHYVEEAFNLCWDF